MYELAFYFSSSSFHLIKHHPINFILEDISDDSQVTVDNKKTIIDIFIDK